MKITLHWTFFSSSIYRIFLAAHLRVWGKAHYITMMINMFHGRILWREKNKLKFRLPLIVDNVKAYLMQAKWNGSQMFVTFMKLIFDGQKLSTTSEISKTTILHISVQPRLSFVILRNDMFIFFQWYVLSLFYFWLIKRWEQN